MKTRVRYALFLLPLIAVVLIPAGIIRMTGAVVTCPVWAGGAALLLAFAGIYLMGWTCYLFIRRGKGTCSPLSPPEKLITCGPYAHIRNPMLAGAFLILLAEILFWQSPALACWLLFIIIFHLFYWPLVEEPELKKRFGSHYELYCRNVPRFFPRRRSPKRNTSNKPKP